MSAAVTESGAVAATATATASPSPSALPSLSCVRTPLLLGTSSKWRHQCVREMGLVVAGCLSPDIDERAVRVQGGATSEAAAAAAGGDRESSDPAELCMAIAKAKAAGILEQIERQGQDSRSLPPPSLLITLDQVCYHAGRIREKPRDAEQCRAWMADYCSPDTSDPGAQVVTAVVVTHTGTRQQYTGRSYAAQKFIPVPRDVLDAAIAQGDILACCGALMVDWAGFRPYLGERSGSEDELVGLPKRLLAELLLQAQSDIDAAQ